MSVRGLLLLRGTSRLLTHVADSHGELHAGFEEVARHTACQRRPDEGILVSERVGCSAVCGQDDRYLGFSQFLCDLMPLSAKKDQLKRGLK